MDEFIMSSKMSEPKPSNPFEKLSDDPILHICSFLPGEDLLKLSEVDKNFKRIITESTETMSKIRLVLDFDDADNLDLDNAIKLAQARRFTGLRLTSVNFIDANVRVKFVSLIELLSGSVDGLIVEGEISRELMSSIVATLLHNLVKCKLREVTIDAEAVEGIGSQSNANHPLESLELIRTDASEVLQFFAGCNQLKTFRYDSSGVDALYSDSEHVNNFLSTQERLKKLVHVDDGLEWNRLTCLQLKELQVSPLSDKDDEFAAAEFLKKLPSLAKLDISINNYPSRRLMKEICRLPKLEKLTIRSFQDEDDEESLKGLVNHTLKQLHIADTTNMTEKLLKIFLGVESIYLCVSNDLGTNFDSVLDLSGVPCETIEKIELGENYYCSHEHFVVKFSPSELPTSVKQFESAVMKFATEFSGWIVGIEIGHESWRNSGTFRLSSRLSNSFCEGLVNQIPELVKFEVFNIADRGRFFSFLGENQGRLNLEDVKLHEPNGAGEPKPKKMKIESD